MVLGSRTGERWRSLLENRQRLCQARPMSSKIPLRCRCGRMRGEADNVSPKTGNRAVCYCDDCQAFAHWLKISDILDAHGGTDIFQLPPSNVRLFSGAEELRCVRLSEKGVYRFYAGCCRTPIGNMAGARWAFIGLIHSFMDHQAEGHAREAVLGPASYIHGRFAIGNPPAHVHRSFPLGAALKMMAYIFAWSLTGKRQPSAFFDSVTGQPRAGTQILSPAERALL